MYRAVTIPYAMKLNAMLTKKESSDCINPPIEIPTIEGGWWQKCPSGGLPLQTSQGR